MRTRASIVAATALAVAAGLWAHAEARGLRGRHPFAPWLTGTVAPDVTAPIDGASLTLAQATQTTATATWLAATDDTGVTSYRLVCRTDSTAPVVTCTNGTEVYNGSGLSTTLTGLAAGDLRRCRACAYDAATNGSTGVASTTLTMADTTAPTDGAGSLTVTTPSNAALRVAWPTATDNVAVSTYRVCYRTDASSPTAACPAESGTTCASDAASPNDLTSLTIGTTYRLRVCAQDAAGLNSTGLTATGVPTDQTVPTDGNVTVTQPANAQNTVSWTAASDNVGVDHYRLVFLTGGTNPAATCSNGTELLNSAATTYAHSSLSIGTTYRYRACAYDAAGNVSAGATGSGVPTDQTAPADGSMAVTQTANARNHIVTDACTDNVGVDHVRLVFLTGATDPAANCTNGTELLNGANAAVDHSSLTIGTTYRYRQCCYDAAGNISTGALGSGVPTDQTSPTDVGSLTVTQNATVLARLDTSESAASDNVAVTNYVCRYTTGATAPADCVSGTAGCSANATACAITGLTDQTYSVRCCAQDAAGNTSTGLTATSIRPYTDTHSVALDGTGDYINVPDSATLNGSTTHFSFCLWVYAGTYANNDTLLEKNEANQREFDGRLLSGNPLRPQLCVVADAAGLCVAAAAACTNHCEANADVLTNGQPAYVCETWDGTASSASNGTARVGIYVNGTKATNACTGTIPASRCDSTSPMEIGAGPAGAANEFGSGNLDEIAYWGSATITQADVNLLCCNNSGGCSGVCSHAVPRADLLSLSAAPTSLWRIDGDGSTTAVDTMGNNNGTYTGNAAPSTTIH